jgi:hypothetical protein
MFQLKPGSMAMIIGARTASGRRNIGKSVELFGLCQPGQRFVNPVNGVMTQLPATSDRALSLWAAGAPGPVDDAASDFSTRSNSSRVAGSGSTASSRRKMRMHWWYARSALARSPFAACTRIRA